jgi:hypothetical protein
MFIRTVRYTSVEDPDAGLRSVTTRLLPCWRRCVGYRLGCVHRTVPKEDFIVGSFWDTGDDEQASRQAATPAGEEVEEAWRPASQRQETYEAAVLGRAGDGPRPGGWMETIDLDGIEADVMERAIAGFEDRVIEALRGLAGFQLSTLVVDRTLGTAVAVSFWADEPSVRASDLVMTRHLEDVAAAQGFRMGARTLAEMLLLDLPDSH